MIIGIDLDNTIISYDNAFICQAKSSNLIQPSFGGSRSDLRKEIFSQENGKTEWMKLQGQIYSHCMNQAEIMPFFQNFVQSAREKSIRLVVISHKTMFGHFDDEHVNIRETAVRWMEENDFFNLMGFSKNDILFCDTQENKINAINNAKCDYFIDDLMEILVNESMSKSTKKILFGKSNAENASMGHIKVCSHWSEIKNYIFSNS